MFETMILITVALSSAFVGYHVYRFQAIKEWEEDTLFRVQAKNRDMGRAYNMGFSDGFWANEDDFDFDPDKD